MQDLLMTSNSCIRIPLPKPHGHCRVIHHYYVDMRSLWFSSAEWIVGQPQLQQITSFVGWCGLPACSLGCLRSRGHDMCALLARLSLNCFQVLSTGLISHNSFQELEAFVTFLCRQVDLFE